MRGKNANIHRGMYPLSTQAEHAYEAVRREIADWIGASAAEEIVFTKGSTEAVNLTAAAFFETWVDRGDNVVVTELEHSLQLFSPGSISVSDSVQPFGQQRRSRTAA